MENTNDCCISDILKTIIMLQRKNSCADSNNSCDRPFLGPINNTSFNTRPIMLYNCCNGTPWTFSYTVGEVTGDSNVFRVESLDDCCCTCRILYVNDEGSYVSTNQFFTINLDCVGAIRCLDDIFVELG